MLDSSFEEFIGDLEIDTKEDIYKRFKKITKRLNEAYWLTDEEEVNESEEEHSYIVGSMGRETGIKGISDLDMLFVLPPHIKQQYDAHTSNGQSNLLQDVKKEIKKIYPKTIVRADGQVIVVSFESLHFDIEICPVFERTDGAFDYPDSNNGGSWKKTNPLPEIDESLIMTDETNSHYRYVCNMIRKWKNVKGFKFSGLLIDTLIYNFFNKNSGYKTVTFEEYLPLIVDVFKSLKSENKDQKYWYALGSNQHVYNKNGVFVTKAETTYNKIKDLTDESEDLYPVLQNVFGDDFPVPQVISESFIAKSSSFEIAARKTEEFIENRFPVDIRFTLKIDCRVLQDGYRPAFLRKMVRDRTLLMPNKDLEFHIIKNEIAELSEKSEVPLQFDIYWKVLNRGDEAVRLKQIRGQILHDRGRKERIERTRFRGEHLVECYVVHNGTVVARDRVIVPIST